MKIGVHFLYEVISFLREVYQYVLLIPRSDRFIFQKTFTIEENHEKRECPNLFSRHNIHWLCKTNLALFNLRHHVRL
jgi:hypothetical protein